MMILSASSHFLKLSQGRGIFTNGQVRYRDSDIVVNQKENELSSRGRKLFVAGLDAWNSYP